MVKIFTSARPRTPLNRTDDSVAEVSIKGRTVRVPAIQVDGHRIIVTGSWLRVASVKGEEWSGTEISDPERLITALRESPLRPDIFRFSQSLHERSPKYLHPLEWDNVAAIPLSTYVEWLERRVSSKVRQYVSRAQRIGVVVKTVEFNDELIRGISEIYNETPIRQGRPFWHYGKDLAVIKRENASYLDSSEFAAAFYRDEMIGFVKIVYGNRIASFMQIIAKAQHNDKRPLNALIAKAVQMSIERGCVFLVYGQYTYQHKHDSSMVEFKRRCGFEELRFPRYYVPLTKKGRVALMLRLHQGYRRWLPQTCDAFLVDVRARMFASAVSFRKR